MTNGITKLMLAGGLAAIVAGTAMAAPLSTNDRGNFRSMERHDTRDAQTGNYAPHGTLTPQQEQRRALGRDAWGSTNAPQIPTTRPSADYPS